MLTVALTGLLVSLFSLISQRHVKRQQCRYLSSTNLSSVSQLRLVAHQHHRRHSSFPQWSCEHSVLLLIDTLRMSRHQGVSQKWHLLSYSLTQGRSPCRRTRQLARAAQMWGEQFKNIWTAEHLVCCYFFSALKEKCIIFFMLRASEMHTEAMMTLSQIKLPVVRVLVLYLSQVGLLLS